MSYETKNQTGLYHAAHNKKTMEAIPEPKRSRRRHEPTGRRTGNKKGQAAQCSDGIAADGFLKHRFLPLYQPSGRLPEKTKMERGFFQSLSILAKQYNCELMDFKDKPYPYNILLSHWNASLHLNAEAYPIVLSIIENEDDEICLATTQTYDTGNTLYYIPIIPLFRLLQDGTRKHSGELLLSVYAYLYQVAGVPYYRDSYSAMDYYYEMMKEWLLDDIGSYEQTDLSKSFSEINAAEYYGDVIQRKLFNRCHLQHFQQRITQFSGKDRFDRDCLAVARDFYELYSLHSERKIFDNIHSDEQEYDNEQIRWEQYISFVADTKGWLFENIEQVINNEFNECDRIEEPVIRQVFNDSGKDLKTETLAFEYRLFDLLKDLCTILNDIP